MLFFRAIIGLLNKRMPQRNTLYERMAIYGMDKGLVRFVGFQIYTDVGSLLLYALHHEEKYFDCRFISTLYAKITFRDRATNVKI